MTEFTFVHMADPQFGLFAASSGKTPDEIADFRERGIMLRPAPKTDSLDAEIELFTNAITATNALRPRFAMVCGDMTDTPGDVNQIKVVKEIAAGMHDSIDMRWAPGNHDLALDFRQPSADLLDLYRREFGDDYYSFSEDGVTFLVLNSTTLNSPDSMAGEADAQLEFVESTLIDAQSKGSDAIAAFSHHPPFLETPDEPDNYGNISSEFRSRLLDLFYKYGVSTVFAGHLHKNNIANSNGLEVVSSGPIGYPLGDDPSGYRVVRYKDGAFEHNYRPLGPAPDNSVIESAGR